jgi:SAM-dependent methyltransferase
MNVIWHDLECGSYVEDLALWRGLAEKHGDPILDVGAGTGRVTLDLARAGHTVTALDLDGELLTELERRANGLSVTTMQADARAFELGTRFALVIVPMQTIQLLGGRDGRLSFLRRASRHVTATGRVAVAISPTLELFEVLDGVPGPTPDMCEIDGVVYASHPTAVRAAGGDYVLERRREVVTAGGERSVSENTIQLDRVGARQLQREAALVGLRDAGHALIPSTEEYIGSTVVILRA